MMVIIPPDQREAVGGCQQPVERCVAQLPVPRRIQSQPGGGAVKAVEHTTVGDDGDTRAGMGSGGTPNGAQSARTELVQAFASADRKVRLAPSPALRVLGVSAADLFPVQALKAPECALSQAGVKPYRQIKAAGQGLCPRRRARACAV